MQLTQFYSETDQKFQFSREQSSNFAKKVARDFNPIHDVDAKRFCVPGDLLFAVLLSKTGISEKMHFDFSGMVNDGVQLSISHNTDNTYALASSDDVNKEFLTVTRSGEINNNPEFIEHVVENYVQFSGKNFPHIMVPLMEEKQLMINPARPLVIYESMELEFTRLDLSNPEVEFTGATMDIEGKRGVVSLNFTFTEDGIEVGHGIKRMIATGLKPYEHEAMDELVNRFNQRKEQYLAANSIAA
ncbi:DUF3581 domain-containing protein [Aliivibrio kagoshimensis]|uniref:DUF3581 domain-containing protein n=1 Tax=Aliivibrio kagoshimensis TaxID=2910230 RepID=UPI003D0DDD3E